MQETKTAQAVALRAQGLSYAEIASRLGTSAASAATLVSRARNPDACSEQRRAARNRDLKRRREQEREAHKRWFSKLTPEQKAERQWRRKCRLAGVNPEA